MKSAKTKALHLRGLDNDLYQTLKTRSQTGKFSLNQFILDSLRTALGINKKPTTHSDFNKYFGSWNESEYRRFTKVIKEQRIIEEDLWK